MPWVVITRGASAATKGAAKGAGAVARGAAKGTKKLGQAAGKGAGRAGQAGAKGARKAGRAGGKVGKEGLDPRKVAQARKAARAGKGGSGGAGGSGGSAGPGGSRGSGRGPLGKGGKPRGWAGRAVDTATGRGGRGGRGAGGRSLPGLDGGGGEAAEGVGDGAAAANEALQRLIRNRLRRRRGPFKKTRRRLNWICTGLLVALLGFPLAMGLAGSDAASQQTEAVMAMQCSGAPPDMMSEQTEIPIDAIEAYCSAAVERQINWAVLAAIGKLECDHGRSKLPGCDREGPHTVNSKGARGPMQFLGSTWRSSAGDMDIDVSGPPVPESEKGGGYATDGDGDGTADPWSWRDATHAAARKLLDQGYAEDQRNALYRYNPSWEYVDKVLALASEYQSKIQRVMDGEDPALPGGGGGELALGDCPATPEGSTAAVPPSNNTQATQTMANTLIGCFGRNGHSVGCWAERPGDLYEHPRGRACDFMMTGGAAAGGHDRERGTAMAEYAMKHANELKIIYIIWYDRIWWNGRDPVEPWSGWRNYGGCNGDPSSCHYNHVHVSVHLQPGDPSRARCTHRSCTN